MKILIAGQAKSGTTALYHCLKQNLSDKYLCLFEPKAYAYTNEHRFVLAKVLINPTVRIDDFDVFDKKVLIVRDPRDNLVSRVLYTIYNRNFLSDDDKVRFFIEFLERKQRDPSSVSVIELLRVLSELSGEDVYKEFMKYHQIGLTFDALHQNYFVYKYEHFVMRKLSNLEEYLGFNLSFNGKVDAGYSRVIRTKDFGDWKNWFTEQDVNHFSSIYHDYMVKYDYDLEWKLNCEPKILPEHSTEYVRRLVQERRSVLHANTLNTKRTSQMEFKLLRFIKNKCLSLGK